MPPLPRGEGKGEGVGSGTLVAPADLLILALCLGVATTVAGYRYGDGNHVSQLPAVLRAMDPGYLGNDFYVNSTAEFGPRAYFARLLAAVATAPGLPAVYFGLTLCANVATALTAGGLARALFHGSNLAALWGACLVMAVSTFELGYTGQFGRAQLLPSTLAQPLLVAALWAGVRRRPLAAGLMASAASLIHPVLGPEVGVLALWLARAPIALGRRARSAAPGLPVPHSAFRIAHRPVLLAGLAAVVALAALSVVRYWPSVDLDAARFVAIESGFRNPHHTLASFFPAREYAAAASFFAATAMAWWRWRRDPRTEPAMAFGVGVLPIALVAFCVVGYAFVEIAPLRLVAIARPFRLLLIAKLLGVVLVAGWVAACVERRGARVDAGLLWLGALAPPALAAATALLAAPRRLPRALVAAVGAAVLLLARPDPVDVARFAAFSGIAAALWIGGGRWTVRATLLALTLIGSGALFVEAARWPAMLRTHVRALQPHLSLADLSGDDVDAARWAARHTPADAVFLVPPSLGIFRLVAARAIVVDFKAFPFQDRAMEEWYRRLLDCCGPVPPGTVGFAAMAAMDENYRRLGDADLDRLATRYGASYAVLGATTTTRHSIVYANDRFRIVRLAE
jgi:hypothetical protein